MHRFLTAFLLLLLTQPHHLNTQSVPDLSLTLSRKALDFLLGQTQKILDRQLATLKLPSASQDIPDGSVEVHEVSLTRFVPPKYYYDLEQPHTLVWGLNDASLYVAGQWSGTKKIVLPSVRGSGGFEAELEQLSLYLKAQLGRNDTNGLTKIDAFQCNATIGNLTTRATGGVMGYVLNIFRTTVAQKVKPLLEVAICGQMKNLIEQDVDRDLLQQFPTHYDVGRKYRLTVSMTQAPTVDQGSIRLDEQVGVTYDGVDQTGRYMQSGNQGLSPGVATPLAAAMDRMIYIRMSEKPVNMLLYTMHAENMTAFIIDETTSAQTASYMRLDCASTENCLGSSMAGISKIYKSPAKGAFRIYTSRTPQIRFNDGGQADLQSPVVLEINVRTGAPTYAEENLLVADVDMASSVQFSIDKNGAKILGTWNLYKFQLTTRPSGVASLGVKIDNAKLADSLRGFVVDQGTGMLRDGFEVPVASTFVPGYTLKNVTLRVMSKVMQFEADMAVMSAFKAREQ